MKLTSSIFGKNRAVSGAVVAAVIAVIAILVGAYIDLKSTPVIPEPDFISDVSTSTTPTVPVTSSTYYVNENYGYSLDYPATLDATDVQNMATGDTDGLDPDSIFIASFPENYRTGTNLTSASIIAGSKKVNAKACYQQIYGNNVASSSLRFPPSIIKIGDIEYTVVSIGDAGAGNLYVTTRYSTMYKGNCYSVSLVARSANDIQTYNQDHPDAPITVYDQNKFDKILDEVMQTFAFTN